MADPRFKIETITEEMRRDYWVNELSHAEDPDSAERNHAIVYPGREVTSVAFAVPNLSWEVEGSNLDLMPRALAKGWRTLAVVRPTWRGEQIAWWLDQPGCIGVKPYYALIGYDAATRDRYIEASIFDFLPHHQLEVINARGAWVTLHVPKADRLGHPDNIREVQEIRSLPSGKARRSPTSAQLHTAARGRGTRPAEGRPRSLFRQLRRAQSRRAPLRPRNHRARSHPLRHRQPHLLHARAAAVVGRTYTNRTNHDFYFNKEREAPEIEAQYTLYMYEAMKALKDACADLGLGRDAVEAMFHGTSARLIAEIEAR